MIFDPSKKQPQVLRLAALAQDDIQILTLTQDDIQILTLAQDDKSSTDNKIPHKRYYRPKRCLPPSPMAPMPPRIMFFAMPNLPICLNILAICAYWRRS